MKAIREIFLTKMVHLTSDFYITIIKRNQPIWNIKKLDLKSYPVHSLGHHLFLFLDTHKIDLIPKHENHDVFHLLTEHGISTLDEMKMQFFLMGNGKKSLYLIISILIALLLFPEYFMLFTQAYQKGKASNVFFNWHFEALLHHSFDSIQTKINTRNENVSPSQLYSF